MNAAHPRSITVGSRKKDQDVICSNDKPRKPGKKGAAKKKETAAQPSGLAQAGAFSRVYRRSVDTLLDRLGFIDAQQDQAACSWYMTCSYLALPDAPKHLRVFQDSYRYPKMPVDLWRYHTCKYFQVLEDTIHRKGRIWVKRFERREPEEHRLASQNMRGSND